MASLFRTEVLEHRQQAWLGGIQLIRPLSLTVLTCFMLAAAAAVVAYLFTGQYTQKARVSGYLAPEGGVTELRPQQAGTVIERHVRQGDTVHAGDVLFVLSVGRTTLSSDSHAVVQQSLAARERSLEETMQRQTELLHEQRIGLDNRLASLHREDAALEDMIQLNRRNLTRVQEELARFQALRESGHATLPQVQERADAAWRAQSELQSVERQRVALRRETQTLEAQRRELPLAAQAQQDAMKRNLAELAAMSAESEAQGRLEVKASQDSVVSAVLAEPGQSVSATTTLASLVPAHAQLQAQLFAPSSAVGFVQPNQPVLLRYQAYPYQKFGHQQGKVLQVSKTPLQANELAGLPLAGAATAGEPLYRITVALDQQAVRAYGRAQALAPGMQLEADVQLDRRRLIEWIFEPLIGVAGRV